MDYDFYWNYINTKIMDEWRKALSGYSFAKDQQAISNINALYQSKLDEIQQALEFVKTNGWSDLYTKAIFENLPYYQDALKSWYDFQKDISDAIENENDQERINRINEIKTNGEQLVLNKIWSYNGNYYNANGELLSPEAALFEINDYYGANEANLTDYQKFQIQNAQENLAFQQAQFEYSKSQDVVDRSLQYQKLSQDQQQFEKSLTFQQQQAQSQSAYQEAQLRAEQQRQLAEYQASPGDWIKAWAYEKQINQPMPTSQESQSPWAGLPQEEQQKAQLDYIKGQKDFYKSVLNTLQAEIDNPTSPTYVTGDVQNSINELKHNINQLDVQEKSIQAGNFAGANDWVNRLASLTGAGYSQAQKEVLTQQPGMPNQQANKLIYNAALGVGMTPTVGPGGEMISAANWNASQMPATSQIQAPPAPTGTSWVSQLVPGWQVGSPVPTGTARLASAQMWNKIPWSQRELLGGYLSSQFQKGIPTLTDYENLIANRLPKRTTTASTKYARQV